ncbi:hypothetical protein [Klebsiella variicola]|uniref:hypothetical protein n=1 Tax=Klebsiella variicola TaxID=244366 RepID=UPI0012AB7A38|nr:hypothetical protein [Klebsiella variicola]
MKASGRILTFIGILIAIYSLFFMDVTVDVGDGTRVNNIGLMAQQQNYILIAVVLFLAGIIISFVGRRKPLPEVDFTKLESFSSQDFVTEKNGQQNLNVLAVDNFSLMLLKKHGSSSVVDILFMNMPLIDRLESGLPISIRNDFKPALQKRLKDNS